MNNIIDIHVHRTHAGKYIPFDKVYLVLKENEALIPKIFGYAIVLPLRREMAEGMFVLRPMHLTHKRVHRADHERKLPISLDAAPPAEKPTPEQVKEWWLQFAEEYRLRDRIVVVPVLTSLVRRKLRPRYLATATWKRMQRPPAARKGIQPAFDEFAYLATPHQEPHHKIQPLCSICPRMLLHLQGECMPGDTVCYKALDFSVVAETESADHAGVQRDLDHDSGPA